MAGIEADQAKSRRRVHITRRRFELKLTQKELGKMVGMSQGNIGNIELGYGDPKISTCRKIADALGESVDVLFPH